MCVQRNIAGRYGMGTYRKGEKNIEYGMNIGEGHG